MDFNLDLILFNFSFELIREFKCKHEVLTVLDCVYASLYSSTSLDFDYFVLCEWVGLSVVCKIYLVVLVLCFFQHCLLLSIVLLIRYKCLFSSLPPNPNGLIATNCNEIVANA